MHSKSTIQWRRELIFFSTEYCSVKLGQHMEHILVLICQHWRLLKFCISRVKLDFFWGGVKIFQNSDVTLKGGQKKVTLGDVGEGGVKNPQKSSDVIVEWPLIL